MKKVISIFIFQLIWFTSVFAKTWETVNYGFWDDESVWLGNEIPPTTSNDTFYIKHPLVITEDLTFESGADILIENDGGLCGHQSMTLFSNSRLVSFGVIQLNSLSVTGGAVSFPGGNIILTSFAVISNGGSMSIVGASMQIGPWFDCILPLYNFLTVSSEETPTTIATKIYPNPIEDYVFIELPKTTEDVEVILMDLKGEIVFKQKYRNDQILKIDFFNQHSGWYVIAIRDKEGIKYHKIFKP